MKKKMMMLMMFLMAVSMVLGSFARAESLELAAGKDVALSILIQNAATEKFENLPELSVPDALAKALTVGNGISGQCVFVGRSMIKRCSVNVVEGSGGEGMGGKLHVFTFDIYGDNRVLTHLRYEVAL